jgi:hypothetical protein
MPPAPELPADIEEYRDARWCREAPHRVETAADAAGFTRLFSSDA